MKIGETKTLNLKFPEDYSHEDSRGKEAIFEVNLRILRKKNYLNLMTILQNNLATKNH